jgi:PD-(D/E)XK nuclease superfamily
MADVKDGTRQSDPVVAGATALLSGRPEYWSYSSLKEIEMCPRRYALSHAKYPDLWSGRGYPSAPSPAGVFGDVVHDALELVVNALVSAGCTSLRSQGAVDVLKSLGGYTRVAERALEKRLSQFDDNPRLGPDRRRRLAQGLNDRLSEARSQIQEYLSRARLPSKAAAGPAFAGSGPSATTEQDLPAFGRKPAVTGVHPEVTLADEELRLMGRIDLLSVGAESASIVDYKTGLEEPSHLEQLQLYALLWDHDRVVNPDHLPLSDLTAAYRTHDLTVEAPASEALHILEDTTRQRIVAADAAAMSDEPEARTSPENCAHCPVRGLCADYWVSIAPDPMTVGDGEWFDYAGIVGTQNGVRSWWMINPTNGAQELLLRTTPSAPAFEEGTQVRLIGLKREVDPEVSAPVALLSVNTDVLCLVTKVAD